MSGPCIFIATNRLKEGRFAAERERVAGLVELIEESETRLLAFNEYANEEGTQVGVVQVRRFRQRHAYTIWAGYVREHEGGVDQLVISDVHFATTTEVAEALSAEPGGAP